MKQFQIGLHNGKRVFTTLSNFSEPEIFCYKKNRKWTRVIILLHGFPDTNTTYNDIWPLLLNSFPEDMGILLLAPTMRGYEPSSQGPEDEYRVIDLADDVKTWIASIDLSGVAVHLIGHDWGAIVAFKTANLYPELITSMVCLAIPYLANIRIWEYALYCPQQIYYSSYMFTMQISWLYRSKLSDTSENSYLDSLWKFWSPTWKYHNEAIDEVKKTFHKPGVIDASTAYYRCIANPLNFSSRRWAVDFDKVPTLVLGGEKDGCMNKGLYDLEYSKLKDTPNVQVKTLPNIGHFLHREEPRLVAELISDWFSQFP